LLWDLGKLRSADAARTSALLQGRQPQPLVKRISYTEQLRAPSNPIDGYLDPTGETIVYPMSLAVLNDAYTLAVGYSDAAIRLWDTRTGTMIHYIAQASFASAMTPHTLSVLSDGETIVAGSGVEKTIINMWSR
jgi:WD40 repeat protein